MSELPPEPPTDEPLFSAPSEPAQSAELPPLVLPPPSPATRREGLIFGPHGVRAGWRVLLFLVLFLLLVGCLTVALVPRHFPLAQRMQPIAQIRERGVALLAVLLPTLLFAWVEKRRLGDYFLPLRDAFRSKFWIGGLLGLASISLFIAALSLTGHCTLGPAQLHGADALRYAGLWGIAFLLIAFGEELLTRGYLLATISRGLGFWPAAVVTSLLFTAAHLGNPGETALGLFMVFLFGMLSSFMVRRTGTLWLAIGEHAFWDWAQSYLYGVADSGIVLPGSLYRAKIAGPTWLTGGTVGPEGSVTVLLILVLTFLVVHALWKRPALPQREVAPPETKLEPVVLAPDGGTDPWP